MVRPEGNAPFPLPRGGGGPEGVAAAVLVAAVGRLLAQQGIVGQRLQAAALEHRSHAPVPADAVASDLLDLRAYNRRDAAVAGGGCVVV